MGLNVIIIITTILGLIPMVTGVSFDFRHLAISWVSESSQVWRSMAIVVIFGLMVATFLTLIVVPTLYSLFSQMGEKGPNASQWLHDIYLRPYRWLAGEKLTRKQYMHVF